MYKLSGYGPRGGDRYFSNYAEALAFCALLGISPKRIACVY
jgi:hypothetical protein